MLLIISLGFWGHRVAIETYVLVDCKNFGAYG
jgi:hypothetical protein